MTEMTDRNMPGTDTDENRDARQRKKREERKKNLKKELLEDIILVIVVLVSVFLIKRFVLINAVIPSSSMENTIQVGDQIFGNRLAYLLGDPQRGDIVIFRYPDNEEELFIKRVIGLPGEKVQIVDGKVYINDSAEPLEEDYLKEVPVGDFGPYDVPEDCYFMMGDNRNWSKDSRYWENTYVERDEILAEAILRYWPLNKFGVIS